MRTSSRIEISIWALTCAIALSFCAGAVTTWLLFELEWSYGLGGGEGSGGADWWAAIAGIFAALGTWIIGAGAWRYAGEAHKLRMFEVRTERLAGIDAKLFALNNLIVKFDITKYCMTLFDEDALEGGKFYSANGLTRSIHVGFKQIKRMDWMDRGGIVLDTDIIDAMNAFNISIEDFESACTRAAKALAGSEEDLVDAENPFLVELLRVASMIKDEADRILERLNAEDERLERDRERIRSDRFFNE